MIERASESSHLGEKSNGEAHGEVHGEVRGEVQGLILAGSIRTARVQPLARSLGVPLAALPVDATRTLFSWWIDSLRATRFISRISVAISDASEQVFYERLMEESGVACQVWVDRNEHRGAAGTVRDFFDANATESDSGLLVAECSTFGDFGLDRLLPEGSPRPHASVLMWTTGQPGGAMYLSKMAVAQIPTIGYFDLKEQLLPAIAKMGHVARAVVAQSAPHRVGNLQGYLKLVETRASLGEVMVSPDASIHRTAVLQGGVLIGRGVEIGAGAVVSGSVVMPGARIAAGAIVARAVVPPGASVQAGARVIDQVYASLDASGREGR
jgi:NDP-sugar pyrophosphorylase family protein